MHRRDLIKKKAISTNDHGMWEKLNVLETKPANNAIKHAKKLYFSDNLKASKGNPRKTWNLINMLSLRNTSKSSNILEIQVDNRTNTPGAMAEAFNERFHKYCASTSPRGSCCKSKSRVLPFIHR